MMRVDFAAAKAVKLSAVISQSVKLERAGHEWRGCCPFHPDKSPSFTVNDAKGLAYCFGCGWHGDAADFVAAIEGCGLRTAVTRLVGGSFPNIEKDDGGRATSRLRTADSARRIWRDAKPLNGTPADRYLWRRGIHMNLPATLRFGRLKHPSGGEHPCLVAAVFSPENGLVGIQRTFLTEDGRKAQLEPVKMSLGQICGSAIRLAPAASELVVCEGLEDGLSLQQELGRAVWVAAGASMLPRMQFPGRVRSIVIAADNDEAGERSAQAAIDAFTRAGIETRFITPPAGMKDFNEALLKTGIIEQSEARDD